MVTYLGEPSLCSLFSHPHEFRRVDGSILICTCPEQVYLELHHVFGLKSLTFQLFFKPDGKCHSGNKTGFPIIRVTMLDPCSPPGKSSKDGELFRVAALGVLELTSVVLVKLVKIVPALHLISQFVIPA